jgi:hypothetical protein
MSKFKVGDKVKILGSKGFLRNCVGFIKDFDTFYGEYCIDLSSYSLAFDCYFFKEDDLELVKEDALPQTVREVIKQTEENITKSDEVFVKDTEVIVNSAGGIKFDQGKLDYTLLLKDLPNSVESVVKVLELGSKRYGRTNYSKVETERYEASVLRHIMSHLSGDLIDNDSGEPHLSHAICGLLFLVERQRAKDN